MAPREDWFHHDLRNRLTVARGFTQLLRRGKPKDDPQKQEEYLEIIETHLDDAMELLERDEGARFTKEGSHDGESVPGETHP